MVAKLSVVSEEERDEEEKEEKGKNVGLNTGVRGGEGSEGGSLFKQPLRCAEKLTHFYPLNPAHWDGQCPKLYLYLRFIFVLEVWGPSS